MITELDITKPVPLRETFFIVKWGIELPIDSMRSFWKRTSAERFAAWLRNRGWKEHEIEIKELSL